MYRGRGGAASRGRSKATPSTVCQKCLKRDTYECTVSAQERPYKARPSRTQQLLNPNLKPKLTTEIPNELLRKKGVADELLAKKEEERGRTRSRDGGRASRDRSLSTSSSDSVSTISTTRSVSRSLTPRSSGHQRDAMHSKARDDAVRKRDRSTSSSNSYTSTHSHSRNVRRRLSSFSPPERGRSRSFEPSRKNTLSAYATRERPGQRHRSRSRNVSRRPRRPRSRSRSLEYRRESAYRNTSLSPWRSPDRMDISEDRSQRASFHRRRDSTSRSPSPRGRRSPNSPIRRRSPSPYSRKRERKSPSPFRSRNDKLEAKERYRQRYTETEEGNPARATTNAPPPPRERSLSPYSKRVAMTRAMQAR